MKNAKLLLLLVGGILMLMTAVEAQDITNRITGNSTLIIFPQNSSLSNTSRTIIGTDLIGNPSIRVGFNTSVFKTNGTSLKFVGSADTLTFDSADAQLHHRVTHENWTLSLWFNVSSQTAQSMLAGQSNSLGTGNNHAYSAGIDMGSSKLGCYISGEGGTNAIAFSGGNTYDDSLWHHIICVYNKTGASEWTVTQWIDGSRIDDSILGVSIGAPLYDFTIGNSFENTQGVENGFIDEITLINYSLTGIEVLHLYNLTSNGTKLYFNLPPPDTTPPKINISFNSTDILNMVLNITGNSSDETGLSFCQIISNNTGENRFYNFSLSGTSGFCSQNITISQASGTLVNFTARINDSSNNFAQSSSIKSVGDITAPVLDVCTISSTSITDAAGNKINITCNATDSASFIDTMKFDINGSLNATRSFSFSFDYAIKSSYLIFESSETLKIGSYSISNVTVTDTSGNKLINSTNFHFEVTSAPSPSVGSVSSGGGGGGIILKEETIIILGNLSLILKPPIINTYAFLCGTFKKTHCRYSIELTANKVLDKCISSVFECNIKDNSTILIAKNSSNSSTFINKVSGKITLIDKAQLAKTIDASVRFINWGYAIPAKLDVKTSNYVIFNIQNNQIAGIRAWFLLAILIVIGSGIHIYYYKKWD